MSVRYEWTGIFKVPDIGEWYLNADGKPWVARIDLGNKRFFILHRVESDSPEGKVEDAKK